MTQHGSRGSPPSAQTPRLRKYNRLRALPETLAKATKLERLELDENPFEELLSVPLNLTSLKKLNLGGIRWPQQAHDSLKASLPGCRIWGLEIA